MLVFSFYCFFSCFFGLLLLTIGHFLGNRFYASRSKASAFECGFDPKDSARLPFSLRFFLLAVVFLIFDIEVSMLFPLVLGMKISLFVSVAVAGFVFLFILLAGLLHEWKQGCLSWVS